MPLSRLLAVPVLVAALSAAGQAQTANVTISFQVDAINQVAFAGTPSLVVSMAIAGSNPSAVTSPATWAVTTNQNGSKISASLLVNTPAGVTLTVALAAPAGATSAGPMALSTTAVDLVTGITRVAEAPLSVTYALAATPAAGVVAAASRVVTYTITGGT